MIEEEERVENLEGVVGLDIDPTGGCRGIMFATLIGVATIAFFGVIFLAIWIVSKAV